MIYDYIIVGGGSAGSVLANRLSAAPDNRVLLVEAGPDTPPGKTPEKLLDSYPGFAFLDPRYQWAGLRVTTRSVSHNQPPGADRGPARPYEQARVLGGGSSINGQLANRGAPADYDEWEARGASGWGWPSVLPYFKRIEHDLDFDGEYHGQSGRIPVRRIFPELWNGFATAMGEAFAGAGFEYLEDQNAEYREGYFPLPISNAYERRVSAATGYLDSTTRRREQLTIRTDTQVSALLLEGARCVGVRVVCGGRETELRANEVILSSGALHSPTMLLRAGIGPAMALRDLGIDVVVDRPGVGQQLMDHPSVALAAFLAPHARVNAHSRRHALTALRYSSGADATRSGDMFVTVASKSSWHPVGEQIGSTVISVYQTFSQTGTVRLATRDWRDEPVVDFDLLSDRRDVARLMDGIRRVAGFYQHPAVLAAASDAFPAIWGDKVRQVGGVTVRNRALTTVAAKLMDGPAGVRRYLLDRFVRDGVTLGAVLADDEQLEGFVREGAMGIWHASCSCRMGAASDPMAVTDAQGRVHGVAGLRVVDASIFPVVPCANTNFPVLMAAEKIAAAIVGD